VILSNVTLQEPHPSVMILKPNQFPEIKIEEEILPVLDSLKDLQLSVQEMFSWLAI
jgi:hypothetical protein